MRRITPTIVASAPIPIIVIEHNEPDPKWLKDLVNSGEIEGSIKALLGQDYFLAVMSTGCRGVPLTRLEAVLSRGVDVDPTDSVISVDHLDKAVEYGSVDGVVVMVFDPAQLKPASIEIPPSTPEAQIDALRREYPTRIENYHGNTLLSRVREGQGDAGYGLLYGRWIPSDPWEVLQMILVVAPHGQNVPNHVSQVFTRLTESRGST